MEVYGTIVECGERCREIECGFVCVLCACVCTSEWVNGWVRVCTHLLDHQVLCMLRPGPIVDSFRKKKRRHFQCFYFILFCIICLFAEVCACVCPRAVCACAHLVHILICQQCFFVCVLVLWWTLKATLLFNPSADEVGRLLLELHTSTTERRDFGAGPDLHHPRFITFL